jgi:hypothetical protein
MLSAHAAARLRSGVPNDALEELQRYRFARSARGGYRCIRWDVPPSGADRPANAAVGTPTVTPPANAVANPATPPAAPTAGEDSEARRAAALAQVQALATTCTELQGQLRDCRATQRHLQRELNLTAA